MKMKRMTRLALAARAVDRQRRIAFIGLEPRAMNTRFWPVYLSGGEPAKPAVIRDLGL
ncbi:hypothetical protein ACQFN5_13850 [Klebsiella sp. WOUb02]|uniref:hypothetical protein n=1 Tax=Klebsiella sp. WOUb02 TaxID=3161071 RepID=UPI003CE848A4